VEKLPNIKSAKKRVQIEKRNNLRNRMVKSELKTLVKNYEVLIDEKNTEKAQESFREVSGALDSAVLKGVVHKNYAARKKSAFSKKLNAIMQ
jgi:small subunit ribosomal protein S20